MYACRICLSDSELEDIFQNGEHIASNIMLFASVQVFEGDGLPQQICKLCKIELDICLSFKNKCETTNETLKRSWSDVYVNPSERPSCSTDYKTETQGELDSDTYSECFLKETDATNTVCRQCNLRFPSETSFNIHVEKKHRHVCNICDLRFDYLKELIQHLKCIHEITFQPEKNKQCHLCGACFKYNAELRRHTLTHSGTKEFKCNQCDKSFSSRGGLNKHIARHSNVRKYPCPSCPKTFIHQSNLHDHSKVHANLKKYGCHICNKKFKTKRTLIYHLRIHTNERDFPCSKCDKAFTNKYDLVRHEKLHDKSKDIEKGTYQAAGTSKSGNGEQCELCGRCCRNVSDLKKHIRVHTGERPFVCSHCEKRFKSTSSLNSHIRIHTQEKPYVCNFCGRCFTQSSNLRTHEITHSDNKPFTCYLCFDSFNRKRDLQRHVEKCMKLKREDTV